MEHSRHLLEEFVIWRSREYKVAWRRGSVVRLDQSIDSQGGKIGTEFACRRFIFNSSSVDEGRVCRNVVVLKEGM